MKRLYLAMIILLICSSAFAIGLSPTSLKSLRVEYVNPTPPALERPFSKFPAGLVFYRDYEYSNNANGQADYAFGSPSDTIQADRSSVSATFVDYAGTVNTVSTSSTLRFPSAYYDETGFHSAKGALIESQRINRIPKSCVFNDVSWTATNMTVTDNNVTSPDGTVNAGTITATAGNATFAIASAVTAQTFSIWIKRKTGTGNIQLSANSGTTWTTVTVTSDWARFSETRASASQVCGIKIVTSADAVYIWGAQFEDGPYPSSLIITTNGALTRAAEMLRYNIANNRNTTDETIVIKFMPLGGSFANDSIERALSSTDTKLRNAGKGAALTAVSYLPNQSDSGLTIATGTTTPLLNTSYTFTGSCSHNTPYAINYLNGTLETSYSANDFINNAWGTYFSLGSNTSGTSQLNGLIQKVAIFNRKLSANEILNVYRIFNQ